MQYIRFLIIFLFCINTAVSQTFKAEDYKFTVEVIAERLEHPWGMAFLPDGDILVTERSGNLHRIRNGQSKPESVSGLPIVAAKGQGGLLDVALHPGFKENRWVYLSFAAKDGNGYGTEVIRGKLNGLELTDIQTIFSATPKSSGNNHFGSRLLFLSDNTLLITLGDRGNREQAQDLNTHSGSLIRINDDGSVPADNPFVNTVNAKSEIYTYGNRNIQGIALQPGTDAVWMHEHGPQGGDEVNIIQPGINYGWPVITYGVNYGFGTKIGEGKHKDGMQQPIHYWIPSIAPSGMAFYTGEGFPKWQGNLFVGSLKFGQLVRLEIEDNKVLHEERMLYGALGRIRDVRQGPGGYLYLLTDAGYGKLLRLVPEN